MSLLKRLVGEPRAHVMLWMLAGKLNDPSRLVKAILEWDKQQFENVLAIHVSLLSELIVDCLFESPEGTLDVETRDQCWSVITKGLDKRHRRRNKHDRRWTAAADWSLLIRAIRAVEIHDGLLSRADGMVTALEQARRQHVGHTVDSQDACEIDITLQAGVTSPCPVVRWTAIWVAVALLNNRPHDVRHAFQQQLAEALAHDPNDNVRGIAARALPDLGSPNALTLLKGALKGDNVPVAAAAAIGLSRLATDDAIAVLCEAAASLFRSPVGSARDALLRAVVGSLEWHVDRVVKSKEEPALSRLLTDEELAGIFLRALEEPVLRAQGTGASALGKMGWAAAWDRLMELVPSTRPRSPDTQRRQASILYACDRLADALDRSRLDEAERLFRIVLRDREQLPTIRRPAVSGIVRLLMRGYRSAALANELLEAARDPDAAIARQAILGLLQLDPDEIFDDMTLLLKIVRPERRQMACLATRDVPTKTGVLLMQWLLRHDAHPDVLASSLDALGETYKKTRKRKITRPIEGLRDVECLAEFARRSLDHSRDAAPHVVSSALKVLEELVLMNLFRTDNHLVPLKEEMTASSGPPESRGARRPGQRM
ncbi:MAG: HEAT repeat domain-containing protein [Gammaproteobacteria bacterium]